MDYLIFKNKSLENLKASEVCYENGLYNASVNRAYYAMFQLSMALLIKDKKEKFENRIDHRKVIGSFVRYYCKEKKDFPQLRDYLGDIQLKRNKADYENESINQRTAKDILKKANSFVNSIILNKLGS